MEPVRVVIALDGLPAFQRAVDRADAALDQLMTPEGRQRIEQAEAEMRDAFMVGDGERETDRLGP